MSKQLDISVGKLGNRSHASTRSSAGQGVGCAGGDLLGGEGGELPSSDERIGLDYLGGGKGPAGAALSLVLDGRDGALLPPVHGGWQVLDEGVYKVLYLTYPILDFQTF